MRRNDPVHLQRVIWARKGDSHVDAQWRARDSYQGDANAARRFEWETKRPRAATIEQEIAA